MARFPLLAIFFTFLGFNFVQAGFISSKNASEFISSEIDEEVAIQIANLFQENFQQPFSWDDPDLLKLLSRESTESDAADAAQKLAKRVSGTYFSKQTKPLLPFSQCVGCANAAKQNWVLEDFTLQFFISRRLMQPVDLVDKCVFYTQRPSIKIKPGLSEPATQWACSQGFKTIWHLWPYQSNHNTDGNFYGIYDNGAWNFDENRCIDLTDDNNNPIKNWLHDIYIRDCEWKTNRVNQRLEAFTNTAVNQGPINIFFSLMSMAMALSCVGRVYVVTDFPGQMPTGGIWGLVEWPTILGQVRAGQINRVTSVAYSDMTNDKLWVDLDLTQSVLPYDGWTPPLAPKDLAESYNHTKDTFVGSEEIEKARSIPEYERRFRSRLLQSRDACTLAPSSEPPNNDFFGWGN